LKNPQTSLYKTNDLQPNLDTQLEQHTAQVNARESLGIDLNEVKSVDMKLKEVKSMHSMCCPGSHVNSLSGTRIWAPGFLSTTATNTH